MAEKQVCIFCGEKPGMFQVSSIVVGKTTQCCCKSCEKEVQNLSDAELCQRALRSGRAEHSDRIRARLEVILESEAARPKCLACGGAIKFEGRFALDASPFGEGLITRTFDFLTGYCTQCGRMELYSPTILKTNPRIAYLYAQDT